MLRKCEDEKHQLMARKGNKSLRWSLMIKCPQTNDDEQFFSDSHCQEEPYYVVIEKYNEVFERYEFEDMVSFAIIAGNGDSSCVHQAINGKKVIVGYQLCQKKTRSRVPTKTYI